MRSLLLILMTATFLLGACSGSNVVPDRPPAPSVAERTSLLERSWRDLQKHPEAAKAELELAKVDRWLRQVEAIRANEDADKSRIPLLLEAIETELVNVHSMYARLDAEARLADAQEQYKIEKQRINKYQEQNEAIRKESYQP